MYIDAENLLIWFFWYNLVLTDWGGDEGDDYPDKTCVRSMEDDSCVLTNKLR